MDALVDSGLDRLHEDYCLALVPHDAGVDRDDLLRLEECLAVRERPEALHAVLRLGPADAGALMTDRLGVSGTNCRTVSLEEMFIELMGGEL